MRFWKQTLPFLLLNILISAVTVFAILYFFGPKILVLSGKTSSQSASSGINTIPEEGASLPAPSPVAELNLVISGVFGSGDLETEYVLIKNQGKAAASLLNWTLEGKRGQFFVFPDLTLQQSGTVKIFSKEGSNSVLDLYMKSSKSLWKRGDILSLKDSGGKLQTSFQVP
ncbi:MAG: lamin tail domain-containing protein [Anaerolineaceae bacterium]|nr:lamin tail domain-containing protein [Anaerolineaceae bacterium]